MKKLYNSLYSHDCSLDLQKLKLSCLKVENIVKDLTEDQIWGGLKGQPNPPNTIKKNNQYTFLSYPFPQVHNLYKAIQSFFYEAEKDYYSVNLKCNYFIKSWINVYYENEFLDWHGHFYEASRAWHGFFCVDTEPSITSYRFTDGFSLDAECKNNTIILGLSDTNKHKTQQWIEKNRPRITIAFDIMPEQNLKNYSSNLWIPI